MLATRYLGLTRSLTLHGHSEFDYPAGNLLTEKLELCDFAVCISHFGRAQAYRILDPKHWHKLFISRCGLDFGAMPEVPPRTPGAPVRVISVARLSPEKGHSGLLQAFSQARYVANCELVLVGDGPERERLQHEAHSLGISHCVTFKGALPEAETLREIAASDMLVLASFMEGLPVVLMEAMTLGKPVIAPHLAGIPDLIHDNENGLLFDPADWDSLSATLETLLSSGELRTRLGIAGRRSVEARFDIRFAVEPLRQRFSQLSPKEYEGDSSLIRASEPT
jgi:glycosyltransferase involved in cell wall biosynthesis